MHVSDFQNDLVKTIRQNYTQGIHKTGKKVAKRFVSMYVKTTSDSSTQTKDAKEVERDIIVEYRQLKK